MIEIDVKSSALVKGVALKQYRHRFMYVQCMYIVHCTLYMCKTAMDFRKQLYQQILYLIHV